MDLARRERPDVAIVDMHPPDLPGHELCRQLRGLLRDITVVALSSYLAEPRVVIAEGLTASELAEALGRLGSPADEGSRLQAFFPL